MKTREELNALKAEVETLNSKLAALTEDELTYVSGGQIVHIEFPFHGPEEIVSIDEEKRMPFRLE